MDSSTILWQAYDRYFLNLGGKKVPAPYRINIPFQEDHRMGGKSSPEKLTQDTQEMAKTQSFDLEQASIEEIRAFMEKNLLGIDCSGYVYHSLDYLLKKLKKIGLEEAGLPIFYRTNVKKFSLDQYSIPVDTIEEIKPGDFIVFQNGPNGHAHILLIMEKNGDKIIYSQSSGLGQVEGIQSNSIVITTPAGTLKDQLWDEKMADGKLRVDYFQPEKGDGVRRLKALL